MKPIWRIILITFGILIVSLFIIRANSPKEIDDMNPLILCEQEYLEKADILWVIPLYEKYPISENQEWCKEILKLNKTIGMHGLHHTYREFNGTFNQTEFEKGIREFEKCFGYPPELFKAPQLEITSENIGKIKNNGLKFRGFFNQIIHKVYHCGDTGKLPNSFHDVF